MNDYSKFKAGIEKDRNALAENLMQSSNPLSMKTDLNSIALSDYSQEIPRPKYDKDITEVVEIVRILNNMAPLRMPVYNFNVDEINGEYYYKPDGTLLLIREDDSDVIRDYYVAPNTEGSVSVSRILEHDKNSGRLRVKIEPVTRRGSRLKAIITIFDVKINNKYTILQLAEDGVVKNITEFTGKGKSFQSLFRNTLTFQPVRYLEGKDSKENGFEMLDCIFDASGNVARIKRFTNKREVRIDYTEEKKHVTVKTRDK